ncbi:hypothetical protein [Sphingomonas sp. MA1305]|uniref:hypothetical protein n=1 Tax=Sphingomonas sp. MA1305 TaxID=2479204 RepID=UPI0018DFE306|nr:hypothetical protein [Sphingomonas sp. MA1305]
MVATAGLALTAIWLTVGVTLSSVFDTSAPDVALRAYPFSATAMAAKAAVAIRPGMDAPEIENARAYAIHALALDPTNIIAVRSLGLLAALRNDTATAARLQRYALYISRRDLPTTLWAIEDAVARGDIAAALRGYDAALLTSDRAEPLLLPVLVDAASDPQIRTPLMKMLTTRPLWWPEFARRTFTAGGDPTTIVATWRALRIDPQASDPNTRALASQGLVRLVALGAYRQAWALSGGGGDLLRNGQFEAPPAAPPFGWQLLDEIDLSGVIQPGGTTASGYALFPSASNGRSGEVASQLVVLPAGRYALALRTAGAFPDGSAVIARCHGAGGQVLSTAPLPAHGGRVALDFIVPPSHCGGQMIAIRAVSAEDSAGDGGDTGRPWIDDVVLTRTQ